MSGRAVRNHLRSGVSARVLTVVLGLPLVAGASSAWAGGVLPTSGRYVAGTGAIAKKGSNGLAINQSSNTGIIDWSSFSIGRGNSVQFNNGAGATLNRVTGGDLSTIAGSLKASGSLYLINPQGVVVSGTGKVVTGGSFVASSRNESDADFLDDKRKFAGSSNGNVTNAGTIKSANGDVVLIGSSVSNSGSMSAAKGTASLNAGNQVLLAPAGSRILVSGGVGSASNSGTLAAAQAQINAAGGNVYALAGNNGGIVRASGTRTVDGHVWLTSGSGNVTVAGKVTATNADGAGGAVTARANNIVVSGNVDVSATEGTKLGGNVSVIAQDTTLFSGTIAAKGGDHGKGGSVETSGQHVHVADGAQVTTLAKDGLSGDWLIDPNDFTIAASGGDITGAQLSTNLGTTDVTIASGDGAQSGHGDIFVDDDVTWSSAHSLTLNAQRNIEVNANVSITGNGALNLNTALGGSGNLAFLPGEGRIAFTNVANGTSTALTINNQAYTLENTVWALSGAISNNASGHYALANNYDASVDGAFGGAPIYQPLNGTFEGLGNTISNLSINVIDSSLGIGLFQQINSHGVVRDLSLTNVDVVANVSAVGSSGTVGTIAGTVIGGGSVSNINVDGRVSVSGNSQTVGGLIGKNYGTVKASSAATTVYLSGNLGYSGGFVGFDVGNITSSFASGAVTSTGQNIIGGFVGDMTTGTIQTSYATGSITAVGASGDAGGFVGVLESGSISHAYATGAVSAGLFTYAGGFVGLSRAPIDHAYSTGSVSGGGRRGGFVGLNSSTINESYETGAVIGSGFAGGFSGQNNGVIGGTTGDFYNAEVNPNGAVASGTGSAPALTGLTSVEMRATSSFTTGTHPWADFDTTPGSSGWVIIGHNGGLNPSDPGSGTTPMLLSEYATRITNAHQLQLVDLDTAASFTLGNDIEASATGDGTDVWDANGFVPIGGDATDFFHGTFDGKGHVVSDLTINSDRIDVGMFGHNLGEIKNLEIANADISGTAAFRILGILAGENEGPVTNVSTSGKVGGASDAGGLVGTNDANIVSSHSSADVAGAGSSSGGLVGENYGNITGSSASGNVIGSLGGIDVGGLVGTVVTGTITDSYATGNVSSAGAEDTGGLAGAVYSGVNVLNSFATGNVTGGDDSSVGGFVGLNLGVISGSYASGTVAAGAGSSAGGFVGANGMGDIRKSYSTGDVTGGDGSYLGGFVGVNEGTSYINEAYETGIPIGTGSIGQFAGKNDGSIGYLTPVYFNADFGNPDVGTGNEIEGGGLSRAQMQNAQNFQGWTFGETPGASGWVIIGTDGSLNATTGGTTPMLLTEYSQTITNAHQIQLMALDLTANYVLGSDIDARSTADRKDVWDYTGFIPVGGNASSGSFAGVFDGAHHTISNLHISASGDVGLFGRASGMIENIGLLNADIFGNDYVGALIGRAQGAQIKSSFVTGMIQATSGDAGGIVGLLGSGSSLYGSWSSATLATQADTTGGLSGAVASGATITQSYETGSVEGQGLTGGIAGTNGGTISFGYATGSVVSDGNYAGGIAGANSGTISDVYASGAITGSSVGGLVGNNSGSVARSIWNTDASSSAFGTQSGTSIQISGLSRQDMQNALNFRLEGWSFYGFANANWVIVNVDGSLYNGDDTPGATTPMLLSEYSTSIASAHQLQLMVLDPGANYTVVSDIDASGTGGGDIWDSVDTSSGFISIGGNDAGSTPFSGTFDGGGHTVAHLLINDGANLHVGLFGVTGSSANIANIDLTDLGIDQTNMSATPSTVGGLVGDNFGTIRNVSVSGRIDSAADASIGGIVGINDGGAIFASGTMTEIEAHFNDSSQGVGGLAGVNYGMISGSTAGGSNEAFSSGDASVGGLVGINGANTANTGIIVASSSSLHADGSIAGGLVGTNAGAVESSFATGGASGQLYAGGLVGVVTAAGSVTMSYAGGSVGGDGASSVAGGFVGDNEGTISQSYTTAGVQAPFGGVAGGFAGTNNGTIENAYSMGNVEAEDAGGFVGQNHGVIAAAYSLGGVSGTNVGGFAAFNNGTVTSSYWDTDTSGLSTDFSTAVGETSAQLKSALSAGFDSAVWSIVDGKSFAYLNWQFGDRAPTVVSGVVYNDQGATKAGAGQQVALLDGDETLGFVDTYADGSFYRLIADSQPVGVMATNFSGAAYSDAGDYTNMDIYGSGLRIQTGDAEFSALQKNIITVAGTSSSFAQIAQSFGGGNITIEANAADFDIDAVLDVSVYNLALNAAGSISESGGGYINANIFAGHSQGAAILNNQNFITELGGFDTGGNAFSLTNASTLLVEGQVNAGAGALTLTTTGSGSKLLIYSQMTAGAVSLKSADAIAEGAGGQISASTLTGSSAGSVSLKNSNTIATLNAFTTGGDNAFTLTTGNTLQVRGAINVGAGALTLTTAGTGSKLLLYSALTGGAVTLKSGDAIAEGAGGQIHASALSGSSVGSVTLKNANVIPTLNAFTTGGNNAFTLTDATTLLVHGAVNAGTGALTLATTGSGSKLLIYSGMTGGTVTLNVANAIAEGTGGSIHASTLTGSSVGSVALKNANAITTLGAFTTGNGAFTLTNAGGLITAGTINTGTGNIALTTTGSGHNLAIRGQLRNSGKTGVISLTSAGNITETSAGSIITHTLNAKAQTGITLTSPANNIATLGVHTTASGPNKITL